MPAMLTRASLWLITLSLALAPLGCREAPSLSKSNLLSGVRPHRFARVTHVDRLTDGIAAAEGDHWLTDRASHLRPHAYVQWDLGSARPVGCVLLQGDNNDIYRLTGSINEESDSWTWSAQPVPAAGMRTRHDTVTGSIRYVRLEAEGGDGSFSVAEVGIFSECPVSWPESAITRKHGVPADRTSVIWLAASGLAGLLFLSIHRKGAHRWHYLLAALALGLAAIAARACADLYPFANTRQESLVRALVAALAGVLIVKESLLKARQAPDPRVAVVSLGLLAALALGCYYHFGSLQFYDQGKGRFTLAHSWDMRNYFPTVKYFPELRFDGVYMASLAAYLEIEGEGSLEPIRRVTLRDLRDNKIITVEEAVPQLEEVRRRFSADRWAEFKRDMEYFLRSMGATDYLGSMLDHGGNATPVWILAAWAILRDLPASETTLSLVSFIDPVLLLVLFVVLWRTFGARVMFYTVILFGATDFYQFGSNLMGSTLRQDWLVALGLGVCALKKERPFLGGMILAYGGLVRAFPALATLVLVVPLFWWVFDSFRTRPGRLSLRALRPADRSAVRALLGAAAAVLLLVGLSTAVFGWKPAWASWWTKIEMHAVGPSVNNVGLRNILGFRPQHTLRMLERQDTTHPWARWDAHQVENFEQLRPVFHIVCVLAVGLAFLGCRGRPLHQVPLFGLLLVPYLFYPSNYYFHFIFLLPLAVVPGMRGSFAKQDERIWALVVFLLLALCVAQFATLAERAVDLRYTYQSGLLLTVCSAVLLVLGSSGLRELRAWKRSPAATTATGP
jgi:hypothetical protein